MQRLAEHAVTICEAHTAAASTERLCIATREVRPVGELMRFVVGPDGSVVPDLKNRLPGRGVWITARRHLVEEAVRRRMFGRGFKTDVATAPLVALIRARDAGEASGRRLATALRRRADHGAGAKIVEVFPSAQLDLALGRLNVVHAALLAGRASETFLVRWRFLEYFRADDPGNRDRGSRQRNGTILEPGS